MVEHILRHYPKASGGGTWPDRAQKLIAFLLGVVSHSVADITWHDIATAEFIQQGVPCVPCRVSCVVCRVLCVRVCVCVVRVVCACRARLMLRAPRLYPGAGRGRLLRA